MVVFQSGELLLWDALLAPIVGYLVLGDFEGSAQEPNRRFNIQPTTQSTGFSDVQLNGVIIPVILQWHLLIFTSSSPIKQHHPLKQRELHRVEKSRLQV